MVAPAIESQFTYALPGQVNAGLRALGFDEVTEAARGADMVAAEESAELLEKGFVMSSCCPAFVSYVEQNFPKLTQHLSHCLSPMATLGKWIKAREPEAKIVFIGPCTAKKAEAKKESVSPYIDCVITFEELQALFDSREIDIAQLPIETVDEATSFGRGFARSGGVTEAIKQAMKERGNTEFKLVATKCNGIEECRVALLKLSKGLDVGNFVEGMACTGGCVGGAGCINSVKKR